jgi:signal transduction histidine kinase
MSFSPEPEQANIIANQLKSLKDQLLSRWREEVRRDPQQAALVHNLDDQELEDHLPILADKIIALLEGKSVEDLEQAAAKHGRQRRELGFPVAALLRELQIFRHVLIGMMREIVERDDMTREEIDRCCDLVIDTIDRSMNVSILQYTLAAEEERNVAQGEARELHGQRDRFLATLSHELRNQVSPILLGAQLLKDLKPADQRMVATIERIERQARHQAILIDDLLDISRFRYGKLQLKREALDLRVPIRHAVENLQNDYVARRLKLEVVLPDGPLMAWADETRVTQILTNLLSNSLKFTSPGGTVRVILAEQAGSAVLTVRDTGVGIDAVTLPHLFTMFFQSDEPAKGNMGLGVGLAVAKVLAELHGGKIEAHSDGVGKGAEFSVSLPTVEISRGQARKVLVVDDNPDHLALLAELLEERGYEVLQAHDATEALSIVSSHKHKPDACVIDIGLPGIDGYELARRLREIPETRDSRLIAVTGYGTKADRESFEEAGFDHFFPKPTSIEELHRALGRA